ELHDWLVYFHCSSVNFLGVGVDGQPPHKQHFAPFGDSLHNTVTKPVPGIDIDPKSGFFFFLVGELSHSKTELHDFVASVTEINSAWVLSNSSDYCQLIVHCKHLQCVLGAIES